MTALSAKPWLQKRKQLFFHLIFRLHIICDVPQKKGATYLREFPQTFPQFPASIPTKCLQFPSIHNPQFPVFHNFPHFPVSRNFLRFPAFSQISQPSIFHNYFDDFPAFSRKIPLRFPQNSHK